MRTKLIISLLFIILFVGLATSSTKDKEAMTASTPSTAAESSDYPGAYYVKFDMPDKTTDNIPQKSSIYSRLAGGWRMM
jgi:hypothetical protein